MNKDLEIDESKDIAKKTSKKGKRNSNAVSAKGQISHNKITCISSCCGSKQVHHSKHSSKHDSDDYDNDDSTDEVTREIKPVKIEKSEKVEKSK